MENVKLVRLTEIERSELIELMNNQTVRRQMPLFNGEFSASDYEKFITSKEQLWAKYGYGPWAFVVGNRFAGWGGLQPEQGEADLALVLHPDFWGLGKQLFKIIIRKAFTEMELNSITVLFPPTRSNVSALFRLGFQKDSELIINDHRFIRYRLLKPINQVRQIN
ncbi:MAG: GNAT family N-acetyltransferase [Cyclobacteriaceae bacterium]|jgi:hypothetical protein